MTETSFPVRVYPLKLTSSLTSEHIYGEALNEELSNRDVTVVDNWQNADVVHLFEVNLFTRSALASFRFPELFRILRSDTPVVVSTDDLYFIDEPSLTAQPRLYPINARIQRWLFGQCDAIIAISESVKRALKPAVPDVDIYVVHHGVHERYFAADVEREDPFLLHVSLASKRKNPEAIVSVAERLDCRFVIAGGGFAGLETAQQLEELFGPDPGVEIVLVSESNSILFKPLLAEVAAGSLDPTDIATPLRTALKRTRVINATVTSVDPDERRIYLDDPAQSADGPAGTRGRSIEYSHLVLGLGAKTDYKGLDDVRGEAFSFTTIDDAIRLRNHIIDCLERAEREPDPAIRKSLLRIVIAGGGFAGAELAGALNDFVRDVLVHYPNVDQSEVGIVIVHSGDRIMPELSDSLADYAQKQMEQRGVSFKLDTRVSGATPGHVSLNDGTELRTETLVWTAGVKPHPMLEDETVPTTEWGAVDTAPDLSVPDYPGLWSVGDCASMPRPDEDGYYPNTAEHGIRAAKVLAENIHADERGGKRKPFEYTSPGSLVVVGYQTACAELWGYKFSGLFAWLIWRAVYLMKLPGLDRKHRVLVDWLAELVFPREMAQTIGEDILDSPGDPQSTSPGDAGASVGDAAASQQDPVGDDGPVPRDRESFADTTDQRRSEATADGGDGTDTSRRGVPPNE